MAKSKTKKKTSRKPARKDAKAKPEKSGKEKLRLARRTLVRDSEIKKLVEDVRACSGTWGRNCQVYHIVDEQCTSCARKLERADKLARKVIAEAKKLRVKDLA